MDFNLIKKELLCIDSFTETYTQKKCFRNSHDEATILKHKTKLKSMMKKKKNKIINSQLQKKNVELVPIVIIDSTCIKNLIKNCFQLIYMILYILLSWEKMNEQIM